MAAITEPIMLDSTGKLLVDAAEKRNAIFASISMQKNQSEVSSYHDISRIVRNGYAEKIFNIGDQIYTDWTDTANSTTYKVPMDIVHFGNVTLQNGEVRPGMYLQWHYSIPFEISFDNCEAFYVVEISELPAGTYNVIIGDGGNNAFQNGKAYQFTLTKSVPVGGQLCGFKNLAETIITSFGSSSEVTPLESVTITEGNEGTNLGTLTKSGSDGILNAINSVGCGYNHWGKSALRQWLNSASIKGSWWKSQHKWDRPPIELTNADGFLTGFSEEFLSIVKPVKVLTASNTVNDDGALYDTYDRFFIPSLEEMFIKTQISGEGEAWDYWREASGRTEPIPWSTNYAAPITYAINAKTSPQGVRLRSAFRGNSNSTWSVYGYGNVSGNNAYNSYRLSPACVIS